MVFPIWVSWFTRLTNRLAVIAVVPDRPLPQGLREAPAEPRRLCKSLLTHSRPAAFINTFGLMLGYP